MMKPSPKKRRNNLARRQAALLRLSARITAARDETAICRCLVEGLHDDELGYAFLGVFLIDPATGDRVLSASAGWEDVPEAWRLRPGQGLSERPLLDGRLHYTPNVTAEARYAPTINKGSEVDLPLRIDDETIGVLVVESTRPDAFDDADFDILTAAVNQASIAIGRARLLQEERQRANEQKALLDTTADLSGELELSRLLQAALERAVALLKVTGGELAIYNESEQELEVVASHNIGQDTTGTRLALGEGAMGLVAQNHEPLIIPEYTKWAGRSRKYEEVQVHSVMSAPLLIGKRLVGAIAIVDRDPRRRFGDTDLRLLNLFAPHAAIAIENARLYTSAQRQRQYFEAVVRNSPVAIVTLDLDDNIAACNPAFERLFGYSRGEAMGKNLDALINTAETMADAVGYTNRAAAGQTAHGIGRRRRKDGSLLDVELAGVPVFLEEKRVGVMALYHDITELLRARRESEAANRAKSQFLANMSHELRTPLNAVIGYSEMLAEEAEDRGLEDLIPDLQKIRSAGKHLLALINDVLDLSKIEAGKMDVFLETFDLAPVVHDVAATIQPLVQKNGNALRIHCPEALGLMHSDLTKVRQVLFNLLSNASKFTEQGTIQVSATRHPDEGRDWIVFRVDDTGVGMTDAQLAKIFEAFSQADASITRRYGGTGLGLAISHRFCQMLGGTISARSEQGKGSSFQVRLPADSAPPAPRAMEVPTLDSSRPRILVIDDDANMRDLLQRTLSREGYQVLTASGGEEGLRLAREAHPMAIALDVVMPHMYGWSVLSALKADPELAALPVIMVTMADDRQMGYALGAAEYLTKPIDRDLLVSILARYRCQRPPCLALVVEDDTDTRRLLVRLLEKDGWQVVEAENGRQALAVLQEQTPHVILLDLMMPEMDGFELGETLQRSDAWRSIPVIVITAKELTVEDRQRLSGSVRKVVQKGSHDRQELLKEIGLLVRNCVRSPGSAGGDR